MTCLLNGSKHGYLFGGEISVIFGDLWECVSSLMVGCALGGSTGYCLVFFCRAAQNVEEKVTQEIMKKFAEDKKVSKKEKDER